MRVFRRRDIAAVRVVPRPGDEPVMLQVVHVDLYFFYGVDVVLLNVEVGGRRPAAGAGAGADVPVRPRLSRPAGAPTARPCTAWRGVEWLDASGNVLARSDVQERETFLSHLAEHRAPRISQHWEYMLAPLVNHHSGDAGPLRFRQIEYYRMPMMAYLAVDDPRLLTRSDFIRLGLVTGGGESVPGSEVPLPYAEAHVADFEQQFCYDRFWAQSGAAPNTRYLCSGLALIAVGDAQQRVLPLQRPRRARAVPPPALPAVPDRALPEGDAADGLRPAGRGAQRARHLAARERQALQARRSASATSASCGFTHRYWFHEVSEQAQVQGAVPPVHRGICGSTTSTRRSRNASTT